MRLARALFVPLFGLLAACSFFDHRIVSDYTIPPVVVWSTGSDHTSSGTSSSSVAAQKNVASSDTTRTTNVYDNAADFKPIVLRTYRFPGDLPSDNTAYYKAVHANADRNRLRDELVTRSDNMCSLNKAIIAGRNDYFNFGLGQLTTILAGAGAIVTAATPARVLSGTAAITNASRAEINAVFYENTVKAAIIQKINDVRSTKLAAMQQKSSEGTDVYTADAMLADVEEYHNDCSFFVGVINLTRKTDLVQEEDINCLKAYFQQAIQAKDGTPAPPPKGSAATSTAPGTAATQQTQASSAQDLAKACAGSALFPGQPANAASTPNGNGEPPNQPASK